MERECDNKFSVLLVLTTLHSTHSMRQIQR